MISLDHIAQRLALARLGKDVLDADFLADCAIFSDGYVVQDAVIAQTKAEIAGWKVALLPDGAVISAPIFADVVFASGAALPLGRYLRHGVECELAFRLMRPLPERPPLGYEIAHVKSAFGEMIAAFELLHSRLPGGFQSPRHLLVADCLGNGGVVLGPARTGWQGLDLAGIAVSLSVDGDAVLSKRGGNPAGDPVRALAALANHLVERGRKLEPGQIVMTGSYTGMHCPRPGETLQAAFDGFATVTLEIDQSSTGPVSPRIDISNRNSTRAVR